MREFAATACHYGIMAIAGTLAAAMMAFLLVYHVIMVVAPVIATYYLITLAF